MFSNYNINADEVKKVIFVDALKKICIINRRLTFLLASPSNPDIMPMHVFHRFMQGVNKLLIP